MRVKFKNGSSIETLPYAENFRGKPMYLMIAEDLLGIKLKWYQKLYLWICSLKYQKKSAVHKVERSYRVITLCGSTRFKDDFIKAQEDLTLDGNIVISVGLFGHADGKYNTILTDEIKEMLDDMHKRKIDMADEIYVINRDGYIGNSTRNEINYAKITGKKIKYMFEQN